jgi:hypothetical protein
MNPFAKQCEGDKKVSSGPESLCSLLIMWDDFLWQCSEAESIESTISGRALPSKKDITHTSNSYPIFSGLMITIYIIYYDKIYINT